MSDARRCPQCGATLPADAPDGLCPKCLLQLGFESRAGTASSGHAGPTAYQPRFIPPTVDELAARFPQLAILEEIGHGGMGVVYKARQKDLDRVVALKILRPDIEHDPAFAERFVREARALGKLSHPAIVTIFDFGRSDGLFFLVMEFVDGANLRQLERTGKLTPTEALRIVPAICEALQYAHDQGVVHRDIKPENILIDKEGRVKIADFGLAKMVGVVPDATSLTGAWQVMGTPHYMAPEQMQGAHAVDHRADIYSLGVVIYEMLTGELPVGRFPLPSQRAQVDVRLDEVVLRALEHEPQRRYQRVTEIKTDVESLSSSAAAAGRASKHEPAAAVPSGGEPTITAVLRHAFGFWSRPQPSYDRRVGWPVMAVLACWFVAVLSLIGLNLAGAPIGAGVINAVLFAGVVGLPVLLIVLTLAYVVRGRRADVQTPAGRGPSDVAAGATAPNHPMGGVEESGTAPNMATSAAPGVNRDQLAAELRIPWIGLLVTGGLELAVGAVVAALQGLRVIGIGQSELLLLIGPSLLFGFVTVMTALRLRSLRHYQAAVAGCIVCAVPLSYGWWMRIAFVALAMFALRRPEARDVFDGQSPTEGASTGGRTDAGWMGGTILLMFALWLMCVVLLSGSWAAGATPMSEAAATLLYAGLFALPPIILLFLIVRFAMESPCPVIGAAHVSTRPMSHVPDPAAATQAPGTALIAVGVMEWIACWLSCLLFAIIALSGDRELPAIFKSRETLQVLLPVVAVLGAALSAIVILAGLKMKRLESRSFAIAGSVLAMFVSPGNVIGLPIGLWALYVLTRPEVKAAFRDLGSASGAPTDPEKTAEDGRKRLQTASDALLVLAAVLTVTGAGVFVWLWQVDQPELVSHNVRSTLIGMATMHLICAALIAGSAVWLRRARARLAGMIVLFVVGIFLPAVTVLNVIMEYRHIPVWPVIVPLWLGVPVCTWAAARLFRPDVRAAFEQRATAA